MRTMRIHLALSLVLFTACTIPPEPESRYLPALEPFDSKEPGWYTTRPVMLLGDRGIGHCPRFSPFQLRLSSTSLKPRIGLS